MFPDQIGSAAHRAPPPGAVVAPIVQFGPSRRALCYGRPHWRPNRRLRQSRLPSDEQSMGDGRDYGLRDQDLGVEAFVLGVAGDDGYQVQVGDDVDNPTAVAARGECAVATFGGNPPKPAVSHRDVG